MRQLTSKYHLEGERVVNSISGEEIPLEEEPLFLLRARDQLASALLLEYERLAEEADCVPKHLDGIAKTIERFRAFRTQYPERMKQPGVSLGR